MTVQHHHPTSLISSHFTRTLLLSITDGLLQASKLWKTVTGVFAAQTVEEYITGGFLQKSAR
ncbi:uncharacterized protein LOC143025499 isoform X3 [Oratosquilla oratoria]